MRHTSSWQPVRSRRAKPISWMSITPFRHTVSSAAAEGVVGEGAVEVLDEPDRSEVADLEPATTAIGRHRAGGGPCRCGRSDEAEVLGAVDPLERHEVVVR